MAITFVAAGTSASGTNPTVTVPATITKDDLLVIVTTGTATPTTPAGWTQLAAQGASQFITVLYKYAAATEASVALTLTGTTSRATMFAYRGAGAFQLSATFATGTSTTGTTNTLTTTYASDFVVSIVANLAGATRTLSIPTGTTVNQTTNTSTTVNGLMVSSETQVAAGTSTSRTSNISISSAWSSVAIAFIPTRTVYWVGGAGTWATPGAGTTGANWADTSGGTGGKIVPSQNDSVTVDSSSGSPTISLSGSPACSQLSVSSIAAATIASTGALTVNGSFFIGAGTSWTASSTITFIGSGSINTGSVTINAPMTFNGVSQTWTLLSSLTLTGLLTVTNNVLTANTGSVITGTTCLINGGQLILGAASTFSGAITHTSGSLSLGNPTTYDLNCLTYTGTGTVGRGVTFGANFVNITSTATATVLDITNATNFTPSGAGGFKLTGAAASGITRTVVVGTTGGAIATAPNVFVAAGAAGSTVEITTGTWVNDLNFTGFSGTFLLALSTSITISGSLTLAAAMTLTLGILGSISFAATSTGKTITCAGKALGTVTFNGVGGGWTLQDTFTTNRSTALTAGALTLNGFNFNADSFSSNGALTRSIAFGSNSVVLTGAGTTLNMGTSTAGWSYTGSGNFNLTYSGGSATTVDTSGTFTEANAINVNITAGTYALTLTSANVFGNLNFTGFTGSYAANPLTIYGSLTAASGMTWTSPSTITFAATSTGKTITSAGKNISIDITFTGIGGGWALQDTLTITGTLQLNAGTLTLNGFDANAVAYGGGSTTNVRGIVFGSNFINLTDATNVITPILIITNATNFTPSGAGGFKLTGAAASGITRTITIGTGAGGSAATAPNIFVAAGAAGSIIDITTGSWVQDLNFTGFSGTYAPAAVTNIAGSLTAVSTMTWTTGTGTINFTATSTGKTITTPTGRTLASVTFNGVGGGWSPAPAPNQLFTNGTFTVLNGTFNANNTTVSASTFVLTGGAVIMGSNTWGVTGGLWTRTGTTITANTSTIEIGATAANATFAGGGATYYNLQFRNYISIPDGILTITGANTFNTLSTTRTNTYTITLPASTTTTVGTWSLTGSTASNAVTINSSTPGVQATLSVASGTVNPIYAYIKDSNATGGATFVSTNAVDLGNNTGWGFSGTAGVLYWVGGTGTWVSSSATNWSSTSGGTGGKPPPTSAIDVFFDGNSGSGTVSISTGANCKSLVTTGSSFTFAGTGAPGVYGNTFTLSPTTVWSSTGQIFWGQTGGILTVTTNGVTMSASFLQQGTGNPTVTLNGNLTATGSWSFGGGGINLNSNSLTIGSLSTFNTPTLTFGTGTVTLTGANNPATILGMSTPVNYTGSGTINISDSGSTARTITTPNTTTEAQALNVNVTAGTYALTLTTGGVFDSLNFTGFAGSFAPAAAYTIYGSLTLVSGMTWTTGTGLITFASTSTGKTITSAGKSLYAVTFAGVGGGWTIQDALTATNAFTLTSGTFNANNFNVTASTVSITGTLARTLTMGSGTWTITGSGTVWNVIAVTNLTLNANTSTIVLSDTSTTTKNFGGGVTGGLTYYNLQIGDGGGGVATYALNGGSNTFNTISSNKTSAYTIEIPASATTTVANWTATGAVGAVLTLTSNSAGVVGTLTKSGGGIVSGINYLNVSRDITFGPLPSGTQKFLWYVGNNSTFGSAIAGGALKTSDTTKVAYQLTTGTSWTVPTDWNSSSNNIYLFGGGGGGGGSVVASTTGAHVSGGGGGGGGFTSVTNATLTPSGSVTYAIGASGTQGSGTTTTSTAGSGGTTSFNSGAYSAGGGGGASTTTTTTTGGTAGTGTTFNGGAGGTGNGTTNATRAGGGGGGSGGINGAGVAGGNGTTTVAGAGGAGNNNAGNYVDIFSTTYGDGATGSINATTAPAAATIYGGGGGGRGTTVGVATVGSGTPGTQGTILIIYTSTTAPTTSSNFFLLF
jgi:hypothetical protein